MWIVLFFVSCTCLLVNGYGNFEILGKGQWMVLTVLECEDPEQFEIQIEVTRKKINRTNDAFSIYTDLKKVLDATYGIDVIVKKEVDGGYKFHSQITDESLCGMAKKYVRNIWQDILTKANIDPPDCPLPVGELKIDDYVIDYSEFKESCMYGKFDISVYITYMGSRLACVHYLAQFEKQRADDEDDDDDDDYY